MTLTELLNDLISSHEITGAFDSEGVLQDTYLSPKAERKITGWYLEQGELISEATAGYEKMLSLDVVSDEITLLGDKIIHLCKCQAREWLKNSDAWKNAESELQKRFDTPPSSFREDTFRALDPTR